VKPLVSLKINCLNKKAQSSIELATFGTVLLLALSFFLRYALTYNYNQDIGMRAFRMALNDAYHNSAPPTSDGNWTPHSSATVVLVEDKHIPSPQDTFGIGDVTTFQSSGSAVWGNTLNSPFSRYADISDLHSIKYSINGVEKTLLTEMFLAINSPLYAGVWVELPDRPREFYAWNQIRVYLPDPDDPAAVPQAMVLLPGNVTELITDVAERKDSPLRQVVRLMLTGGKSEDSAEHGEPVIGFYVLDPRFANLNPEYFVLNADTYADGNFDGEPDVTVNNMQGLLAADMEINRQDSLKLEESPGGGIYRSVGTVASLATVHHEFRENDGITDEISNINIGGGANKTWETPK